MKKELEQSIIRKLHGANLYRIIMMFIGSILLLSTILLQSVYAQNAWKLERIFLVFHLAKMTGRQLEGQELGYQTELALVFVLGDHLDQQARKLQQDPQVLKEILEILDQPDLKESKVQQMQQVQQDRPTRLKLNYKMVRGWKPPLEAGTISLSGLVDIVEGTSFQAT